MVRNLFKVRPFPWQSIGRREPVEIKGTIEDGSYVLSLGGPAFGIPYAVETEKCGEDERGPFALIPLSRREHLGGFVQEVRVEPQDELPEVPGEPVLLGCEIAFERHRSRDPIEELARSAGIDPETVNLLVPLERGFSVHFHWDGGLDGTSLAEGVVDPFYDTLAGGDGNG